MNVTKETMALLPGQGQSSLYEGPELDARKAATEKALLKRLTKQLKERVRFKWRQRQHGYLITACELEASVIIADAYLAEHIENEKIAAYKRGVSSGIDQAIARVSDLMKGV